VFGKGPAIPAGVAARLPAGLFDPKESPLHKITDLSTCFATRGYFPAMHTIGTAQRILVDLANCFPAFSA